jgi:hypothetical protein
VPFSQCMACCHLDFTGYSFSGLLFFKFTLLDLSIYLKNLFRQNRTSLRNIGMVNVYPFFFSHRDKFLSSIEYISFDMYIFKVSNVATAALSTLFGIIKA